MHTIAMGSSGHLGLYRLETQVTSGNGGLRTSGLGSNASAREAIKVGYDYFKANASRVSASIKAGDHDYHLHGREPAGSLQVAFDAGDAVGRFAHCRSTGDLRRLLFRFFDGAIRDCWGA
jgi:hypothetical protein